MLTKAKAQMFAAEPRLFGGARHIKLIRVFENGLVTVGRGVPHNHLIALLDQLAADLDIAGCGTAHMHDRADIAHDLLGRMGQEAGVRD